MDQQDHLIVTLREKGELAGQFEAANIRVLCLNQKNLISISCVREFVRMIKRERPQLIISYLFHADLIARFAQPFITVPVVSFLRAVPKGKELRWVRIFERLTKFFAGYYFANSQAIKDFYDKFLGVSAEKITVLPNGIDTKSYQSVDGERIRKEINASNNTIVFSYVANFHPGKGHSNLLSSYEKAHEGLAASKLLLVGDGSLRANLERYARSLRSGNDIIFMGKRTDIKELLAASDIFVFASLHEGMSNALLEAMASRLPIIACNIPENQIVLGKDGALYVEPEDDADMANAMLKLAKDTVLRQTLATRAYRIAVEKFDIHQTAALFSQAITWQLEKNRQSR